MKDENVSTFLTYLEAEDAALSLLQNNYQHLAVPDAESRSYQNIAAFLAYLSHGKAYNSYGKDAPLFMKPVLLFYGMTHFMKASLLLMRPAYPESTADLAHGLSSRKRKKQDYQFSLDEVLVQKRGLFPYFSRYICQKDLLSIQKLSMGDMLAIIPELQDLLLMQEERQHLTPAEQQQNTIYLSSSLPDHFQYTQRRFRELLHAFSFRLTSDDQLAIQTPDTIWQAAGPLFYSTTDQQYHFLKQRSLTAIHECMAHYVLLYNLSMICRYETEWWTDFLQVSKPNEYPLIVRFLEITCEKVPLLIGSFMQQRFLDTKKAR
jgi:YaaC-like Protein